MKPTILAIRRARALAADGSLTRNNIVTQRFAEKSMDEDDHSGAEVFRALKDATDLVLTLADGFLPETGKKALELFEHRAEYWEYLMDRAGDMSRRDIASLIISRMSLADIAEDYEDMKNFREEI